MGMNTGMLREWSFDEDGTEWIDATNGMTLRADTAAAAAAAAAWLS